MPDEAILLPPVPAGVLKRGVVNEEVGEKAAEEDFIWFVGLPTAAAHFFTTLVAIDISGNGKNWVGEKRPPSQRERILVRNLPNRFLHVNNSSPPASLPSEYYFLAEPL